ncbi:MAG: amidoligase family protein [Opitutales bacterium]|nr:amidoligase family protein [Opitutales bacterium]
MNSSAKARKVGVELELGGLDLSTIVQRVQAAVGGEHEPVSLYESRVTGTSVGDMRVELDAILFREFKLRGFLKGLRLEKVKADLGAQVEKAMATEARRFVPFELVFDPIETDRIKELEAVRESLFLGAEGTGASVFNAFGLHFNPELDPLDASIVLKYLQAFLILYEELKDLHGIDSTRRISPFIDPYPKRYVRKVLNANYRPDIETLIDDYLDDNPTRNRPLDLLPIFCHLDEERVRMRLPDEKISKRPTLHYRLPDCRIDEPGWTISGEWEVWLRVEQLANNPRALYERLRSEHRRLKHPWRSTILAWVKKLKFR